MHGISNAGVAMMAASLMSMNQQPRWTPPAKKQAPQPDKRANVKKARKQRHKNR